MGFEKFVGTKMRKRKVKASLRRSGHIGLNTGVMRRVGHKDRFVRGDIYFDAERGLIGLELLCAEKVTPTSNKLIVRNGVCMFCCKPFLDFHCIDYRKTKAYPVRILAQTKVGSVFLEIGPVEMENPSG